MVHDYFRAILEKGEVSKRALALTEEVINQNSANYTAWQFRRECIFELKEDLEKELEFTNEQCEKNIKNYQVWYHRKVILEALKKVDGELEFLSKILSEDEKNYHVWAHREWVVKTFNLFEKEFDYTILLLKNDFRNNSAWNYRFFLFEYSTNLDEKVRNQEIDFAFSYISKSPNNESAWNYAKGMATFKTKEKGLVEYLLKKTEELISRASLNVFGNSMLVFCYTTLGSEDLLKKSIEICEKLSQIDGIRKNYWEFKKEQISKK